MEDVAAGPPPAPGGPRRRWRRLAWAWGPALAYLGLIFHLSSRPASGLPKSWWMSHDKLLHVGEYALLGALLVRALAHSGVRRLLLPLAALGALAWGWSDELHQSFVAGRQGNDLGDLLADGVGGLVGAAAALLLRARRRLSPHLLPVPPRASA